MSISVGGIDIPNAILNLEYELARTQRILEWIVNNNRSVLALPPMAEMSKIEQEAFEHLKKKYPDAGIERKPG